MCSEAASTRRSPTVCINRAAYGSEPDFTASSSAVKACETVAAKVPTWSPAVATKSQSASSVPSGSADLACRFVGMVTLPSGPSISMASPAERAG